MAKLTDNAQKVWDRLPENGTKVGGITLQRELDLSKLDYKRVLEELKSQNLTEAGRGRGGSLGRREGAKIEEGPSLKKRMEMAREAKVAKSRQRKEVDERRALLAQAAVEQFDVEPERVDVHLYGEGLSEYVIYIWDEGGKAANGYRLPRLEYDKLMATGGQS